MEYLEMTAELNRKQPGQRAVLHVKPTAIFPNQLMENYSKQCESRGIGLHQATNELSAMATSSPVPFSHDRQQLTRFCMQQMQRVSERAAELDVPVLVDGELRSTHFMLHALTLAAAKLYNTYNSRPLIFGTFQCYMKDTPTYLAECQRVADAEAFTLGAKCVRGAYLDTERALATQNGYADPTHPSFEATSAAYDAVIGQCLQRLAEKPETISLYIGTHNRASIEHALQTIDSLGIPIDHEHLQFGQIYGFCDHLTHALGQIGARVYKSTPWGPLDQWIPYFGRKAAENHTALQTARNEMPYFWAEARRRVGLPYSVKAL